MSTLEVDRRAVARSWTRVRQLADRYPDQWEGQDLAGDGPLRVFAGARTPRRVLVVTKEAVLSRWPIADRPPGLAVVVASGISTPAQSGILARLAPAPSAPIAFVGDADPMGLHTCLSMLAHLGARRVRFCGVSDRLLDLLEDDSARPHLRTLELSAFDREHLRVVEALAKPETVLGPRVAAVLREGKKITLEALGFRAGLIPALFKAALRLARQQRGRGPSSEWRSWP
ncbi:MAG TPA: hypothetical protein VLS93_08465 [Anaeromyxobacteraceae bacterium]|nr:hypothetical protein [Anaeromyxobacteraceae bacterium]